MKYAAPRLGLALAVFAVVAGASALRAEPTAEEQKADSGRRFGEAAGLPEPAPAVPASPAAAAKRSSPGRARVGRPEETPPAPPAPEGGRGGVRKLLGEAADGTFNALCRGIGLALIGVVAIFVLGADFFTSANRALATPPRRRPKR